jgi:hypothetical protein
MHPSWTSSLVVQRFGCTALIVADDLILSSLSAHAATARALMTGDLVRRDQEGLGSGMGGKGFHGAELDWLFFKGRTIRGVNGRLRSGGFGLGGEGDSTIAAIADLIMIEVSNWFVSGCIFHYVSQRSFVFFFIDWSRYTHYFRHSREMWKPPVLTSMV